MELRESLSGITQDFSRSGKPVSFRIMVPGIGEIECIRVFRVIASKRIVCQGRTGGRNLIVKLYYARRGARRHWKRSDRGCRAFLKRGVPAPEILFSGYLPACGAYALVMEYLDEGKRLDRALESATSPEDRNRLLDALMAALAGHHAAGIMQQDLHLGNFMIGDGIIYSLDGDQVKCRRPPVGRKDSLENLSRLLASLPGSRFSDLAGRISEYAGRREWVLSDGETAMIREEVRKVRKRKLSEYLDKIFKSRDPFISRTEGGTFSVYDKRHADVNLPEILEASKTSFCFKGSGYDPVSIGGRDLKVWSATAYGPFSLHRYWKACRIWKTALTLLRLGVSTHQPVVLILRKSGIWRWHCFVFFKPVTGETFRDLFESGASRQDREDLARQFAEACEVLDDARISFVRLDPEDIIFSGRKVSFIGLDAVKTGSAQPHARNALAFNSLLSQPWMKDEVKELFLEEFMVRNLV